MIVVLNWEVVFVHLFIFFKALSRHVKNMLYNMRCFCKRNRKRNRKRLRRIDCKKLKTSVKECLQMMVFNIYLLRKVLVTIFVPCNQKRLKSLVSADITNV